ARAQTAAGTLHPEHFDRLAAERVFLHDLGGRVSAAGVGDPLVAAEQVRAVNQPPDRVELRRSRIIPQVVHVLEFGWHKGLREGVNSKAGGAPAPSPSRQSTSSLG